MTVYSCHTPSGRTAGTAGWAPTAVISRTQAIDDCVRGPSGSIYAEIGGTLGSPASGFVSWSFSAAPSTMITAFATSVCARAWGGAAAITWPRNIPLAEYALKRWPDAYGAPSNLPCAGEAPYWSAPANLVQRTGISTPQLWFVTGCFPDCRFDLLRATIDVSAFRADIRDDVAPTVRSVSGPLATNATHTGVERVDFAASDVGVGVFRGVVEVRINGSDPWRELAASNLAPGQPSCSPLRETQNLYEFDSPQPCPLNVAQASLSLDSALVPEGTHQMRAYVEDAAGNRAEVLPPRPYVVPSRSTTVVASAAPAAPTNGRGASRLAQLRITAPGRPLLSSAREFRLAGRLLDSDSNPIAGATVLVQSRPFLPKAGLAQGAWGTVGTIVTDDKGVFRGRIAGGASRSLLVTYAADPADPAPSANAQVDLVVPAQVTVTTKHRRVRNGRSVVLTGRVSGPIPHGGVLVAMEVREPGRWIPVATTRRWVRTSSTGTFKLSYRFRNTFRPATYRFRVVADEDSAFPYGRGASRSIMIRVRP